MRSSAMKMVDGEIVVAPELFEAKGELQVRSLRAGGREWRADAHGRLFAQPAEDEAAQ